MRMHCAAGICGANALRVTEQEATRYGGFETDQATQPFNICVKHTKANIGQ